MKTLIAAVATVVLITLAPVETRASDDPTTVLVVRHRWHTGIVLPADRLAPSLAFLDAQFNDPVWYEIGWGDNDFYRRTDNLWLLGKALFWPTDTVLHVVGLDKHPADLPNSDVQALCLSADGLKRLQAALAKDFRLGADGRPVAADPGLYGDSRFFSRSRLFLVRSHLQHLDRPATARRRRGHPHLHDIARQERDGADP